MVARTEEIAPHFGSKAKLSGAGSTDNRESRLVAGEIDVLKIDSDTYLSDIDDSPNTKRTKSKQKSVETKPTAKQNSHLDLHASYYSGTFHTQRGNFHTPRGARQNRFRSRPLHSHSGVHRSFASRSPPPPPPATTIQPDLRVSIQCKQIDSLLATPKQFETRGTQTERTGPCKCARAVQQRNKRRRIENQQNKELIREFNLQ